MAGASHMSLRMRAPTLLAAGVLAAMVSSASSFAFSANSPAGLLRGGLGGAAARAVGPRPFLGHPLGQRQGRGSALQAAGLGAEGGISSARMMAGGEDQGKPKGKSVLVISWFYAEPKQIELVKRIYKKKGFSTVEVQESPVYEISTPRGWYKTFIGLVKNMEEEKQRGRLARKFDVVHCMSGGFLNLYLILAAKIPLEFEHLVMDSTPIMPKPAAFVRFARAYFNDNGLELVTKVLPESVHVGYQTFRWSVGASYVRIKHKAFLKKELKALDQATFEFANDWSRWAPRASATNDYPKIVEHSIETVFNRPGLKTAFVYNENDAYINPEDVKYVIKKCKEFGGETTEVLTETKHIETIFRKPNILFGAIDEIMGAKAKSAASP